MHLQPNVYKGSFNNKKIRTGDARKAPSVANVEAATRFTGMLLPSTQRVRASTQELTKKQEYPDRCQTPTAGQDLFK
ncbi:hypothetical protein [Zoogloea sp. LCSB751]|uniref:hypothetical protein n=1 Tax=Zoogloea sp. LCSB751 TaxID=1965277 RepID=UPI0011171B59|nr:hypothetical protein [Zoogloea sp. LCSB751]